MEHAFVAAIRAYYSNGVDFIEPLDVSTIFGNGLDNAIEASEKPVSYTHLDVYKRQAWNDRFSAKDRKDHIIKTDCKKYYGNKTQYEGYRSSN